jgi:hypothetical protein
MRATVWRNGEEIARMTDGEESGAVDSLCLAGRDVYAGGFGFTQGGGVATVWKNGSVLRRLTDGENPASVKSLAVSGGGVYAGGHDGDGARVWKDGSVHFGSARGVVGQVDSLHLSGADVYAGGHEIQDKKMATVWKNGKALWGRAAGEWRDDVGVSSLCLSGADVYAAGNEAIPKKTWAAATVWKNGEALWRLTDGGQSARANSICIQEVQ